MGLVQRLQESLNQRWRPEQVAKLILDERASAYTPAERALLARALPRWSWSSMGTDFVAAGDMRKQCATAAVIFGTKEPEQSQVAVRRFIDRLKRKLRVDAGTDFKKDRRNRRGRKMLKLPKGHRAYNKRFRIIASLEKKFQAWGEVIELRELAQIAKSRLACRVGPLKEIETACFVAWMTARLNVRSMFTFGKQERAFDEIAAMLLKRVSKKGDWYSIAMIHPAPEVVANLTAKQKGQLLAEWFKVMKRASDILARVAKEDQPNLESMIVRRGNDSSTWNEAAGAFNKARDGWVSVLHALGADDLLDKFAPGKALRLMAADVAWGHRAMGGGLDPDTKVWGALPKPWDVMSGKVKCNRSMIEAACLAAETLHGGWIAPRQTVAVRFKATPELVHGVVCVDPSLATILKKAGYFGGYGHKAKISVGVARPFDGEKIGAAWPDQ